MRKGLYFKIFLILVIFILSVMSVVGAVLISSVLGYYNADFTRCMEENFAEDGQLCAYLTDAMTDGDATEKQKAILSSYASRLGIDDDRNYYILDGDGAFLGGSDTESGVRLAETPNLIAALGGGRGDDRATGSDYADFAVRLSTSDETRIIYIRDSRNELRQINSMLFSIVLQALFVGLLISFVLSFFLARAIAMPLANLTEGVQRVADGNFREKIEVHSTDEIGVLTENFNRMSSLIEGNLDEINGEREKLETVLSCLKDAVVTFGEDGRPLQINSAAKKLFADVDKDKFSLDYIFGLLNYEKDGLDMDIGSDKVVPAVHYRDQVYELYFGNIRYRDGGSMRAGFLLVIHDVTQSFALDRSRREFVANVSHELRTPLTTIRMVIESLAGDEDLTLGETERGFLQMAESESERMEQLIRDLLILSRLDNRSTKFAAREYDIAEALTALVHRLSFNDSGAHTISLRGADTPLFIRADPARVEQILTNIATNALKYTPAGGKVDFCLTDRGDDITVAVTDTGIGIPKEDIPHLFERFYRVEKARNSDKGGTGLGLAIAKEFALAHGGDITVDSILGKGTSFTLILPKKSTLPAVE